MLDIVYPRRNRELFSGRSYFLNLLDKNLEKIKKNNGKNIALLGPRFIGKSTIVREFIARGKDIDFCYLDFEKTAMSPERFAVEFIGQICFWVLKKKYVEFSDFQQIENLIKISGELKSDSAEQIIKDVENELSKIKPDQNLLVTKALSFVQELSKESGKTIVVCIKEFQNILSLENYEGIKDVLSLFNDSINSVNYIVTSSENNSIKEKLSNSFSIEEVGYMDKDETNELIEKTKIKADINLLFKLTKGHPLYSISILGGDLEKRFVQEILIKKGIIYSACKDIFLQSLNKARGQTLLIIILKVLANEENLRLNEVSKRIHRSSPITKNLLSRLMIVDLIKMEDKKFSFSDKILRYWVKNVFNGLEFDDSIDEKILDELVKELE